MKIALLGYGKMGQEIARLAEKMKHEVKLVIDSQGDWEKAGFLLREADVAFEFSTPATAVENIYRCFEAGVPVIVGTTGWLEKHNEVKQACLERNMSLFFAPNYSIGMNLFFNLNRHLAKLMSDHEEYEISIEETHHVHKQD